jgi:hypothetical protein
MPEPVSKLAHFTITTKRNRMNILVERSDNQKINQKFEKGKTDILF